MRRSAVSSRRMRGRWQLDSVSAAELSLVSASTPSTGPSATPTSWQQRNLSNIFISTFARTAMTSIIDSIMSAASLQRSEIADDGGGRVVTDESLVLPTQKQRATSHVNSSDLDLCTRACAASGFHARSTSASSAPCDSLADSDTSRQVHRKFTSQDSIQSHSSSNWELCHRKLQVITDRVIVPPLQRPHRRLRVSLNRSVKKRPVDFTELHGQSLTHINSTLQAAGKKYEDHMAPSSLQSSVEVDGSAGVTNRSASCPRHRRLVSPRFHSAESSKMVQQFPPENPRPMANSDLVGAPVVACGPQATAATQAVTQPQGRCVVPDIPHDSDVQPKVRRSPRNHKRKAGSVVLTSTVRSPASWSSQSSRVASHAGEPAGYSGTGECVRDTSQEATHEACRAAAAPSVMSKYSRCVAMDDASNAAETGLKCPGAANDLGCSRFSTRFPTLNEGASRDGADYTARDMPSAPSSTSSKSTEREGGQRRQTHATTYAAALGDGLRPLKKISACANHVWICSHDELPGGKTFVVKLADTSRSSTSSRRRIWARHLAIKAAGPPPPNCLVNVLGCCRASLNELDAHPDLRACMPSNRQDEPCLFMVVERLPGTLLDFWLHFRERRYCLFTASSFLRDLLRVCLWLEENSLYLYDFKLENFFIQDDGRLVLGDLDTVFHVKSSDGPSRLNRPHCVAEDGIYGRVDVHPMPFQAPEVRMACERLNADKHHAEVVDYTKAHAWSCAAMIYYYLSGYVMPVGAKFNDRVLDRHLQELEFLCETADPRTNDQGVYISQVLSHMLDPDASVRWDTPTALKAVEARFVERQFAVDFDAKFRPEWGKRLERP